MSIDNPELLRAAVGECVTVLQPGEVLAVRVAPDTGRETLSAMREAIDDMVEGAGLMIVVIACEEFARLVPAPARGAG